MSSGDTSDIRKKGFLIKLKTNKKKLFVLRDESTQGPARLEYYDSEKKLRSLQPKRSIVLRSCFNIGKRVAGGPGEVRSGGPLGGSLAGAGRFAIVLFTKDDYFTVGCDSEADQLDWLTHLNELRTASLDESSAKTPLFEHIWPVSVKAKELGNEKKLITPGQYRLCLTNNTLSLIRLNEETGTTIPIDYVKRVGHSQHFVFLELGRSAITGPGSLWLQVEDAVIAQNIHSAVLNAMKLNQPDSQHQFRGRSHTSTVTGRKKQQTSPTGVGAGPGSGGAPDSGEDQSAQSPAEASSSNRPQRSQTIHGLPSTGSALQSRRDGRHQTYRPISDQRRSMLDTPFSQYELGHASLVSSLRAMTPETPIEEDESLYLSMTHEDINGSSNYMLHSSPDVDSHSSLSVDSTDGTGRIATDTSTHVTSHQGTLAHNTTSDSFNYLNMAPRHTDVTPSRRLSDFTVDQYLDMTPQNLAKDNPLASDGWAYSRGTASSPIMMPQSTRSSIISRTHFEPSTTAASSRDSHSSDSTRNSSGKSNLRDADPYMDMLHPENSSAQAASGTPQPPPGPNRSISQECRGLERRSSEEKEGDSEYVSMSAPGNEGYLPMGVRRFIDETRHGGSSSSVSSVISSVCSSVNEVSDVTFRSLSRLPEISTDAGYIEMSSPSQDSSVPRPRLDTVHSYLREDDAQGEQFPVRAYSVGSKPVNQHYLDMTGRKGKLKDRPGGTDSLTSEKSSSAPHLNDDASLPPKHGHRMDARTSLRLLQSSGGSPGDTIDDRFMELDFHQRTAGGDLDLLDAPRFRSSSGGAKDLRAKAFSFSGAKDAINRLPFFKKTGVPVVPGQTSHKASLRAGDVRGRRESFGSGNLPRPRAATEGNSTVVGSALDEWATRRVASRDANQGDESRAVEQTGNEIEGYIDMSMGQKSSNTSDYLDMKPTTLPRSTSSETETSTKCSDTDSRRSVAVENIASSSSPISEISGRSDNVKSLNLSRENLFCEKQQKEETPSKVGTERRPSTVSQTTSELDYTNVRPQSVDKSLTASLQPTNVKSLTDHKSLAVSLQATSSETSTCDSSSPYMDMNMSRPVSVKDSSTHDSKAKTTSNSYMAMKPGCESSHSGKPTSRAVGTDSVRLRTTAPSGTDANQASPKVTSSLETKRDNSKKENVGPNVAASDVAASPASSAQLTYATLDLSSESPSSTIRQLGVAPRRASRQVAEHVYSEIDFEKSNSKRSDAKH